MVICCTLLLSTSLSSHPFPFQILCVEKFYTRKNIINTSSIFTSMARTSRSRSPPTPDTTLTIRTRDPLPQYGIDTPIARKLTTTQADRCRFPGCSNTLPHQHPTAGAKIAPSLEEYRKAGEAIRARWTEEQRRQIAENEASLRQLAEIEPDIGNLSLNPHPPCENDLTVQDQNAIIHDGGATPAQYEAARDILLEGQHQDIVDNTRTITPGFRTSPSFPHLNRTSQTQTEPTSEPEWDGFPELDAQHEHPPTPAHRTPPKPPPKSPTTNLSNSASDSTPPRHDPPCHPHPPSQPTTNSPTQPCTAPCPIQTPHNQGAYLQQGQVPRVWNARWGYSDPPRGIWEAWVRVERGRGRGWDEVVVRGFAGAHWWGGV